VNEETALGLAVSSVGEGWLFDGIESGDSVAARLALRDDPLLLRSLTHAANHRYWSPAKGARQRPTRSFWLPRRNAAYSNRLPPGRYTSWSTPVVTGVRADFFVP